MRLCKDDKSVLKREIFACEANRILPTRQGRRAHGEGHKGGHQGFHPYESRFLLG